MSNGYLKQKTLPKTTGRIQTILLKKSILYQRASVSASTLLPRAVVVALTGRTGRKYHTAASNENGKFDVRSRVTQEL